MRSALFHYLNLLLVVYLTVSCNAQAPVRIIFDTDMGSDCDDAGALALLHTFADEGKAEIIGCVYSSGQVPYGAGIIQSINHFYGRPYIPVGAYQGNDIGDLKDKMRAAQLLLDTNIFRHDIATNADAEDQTKLTRRLLAAQPDRSITYVTVGHTKGLYDLLTSNPDEVISLTGKELIRKKVGKWVAMGGLQANNPERDFKKDWNLYKNGTASYTKYLVEHFPVPIYYVSAGSATMTGRSLKCKPNDHVLRVIYETWLKKTSGKTLDDQRPSWDLAAVYFAVEGEGNYLKNTGRGWMEFDTDRGFRWHREHKIPEQYYITDLSSTEGAFADYLNKRIAWK